MVAIIEIIEVECSAIDDYPIAISEAHRLALLTDPETAVTYWCPVHIKEPEG